MKEAAAKLMNQEIWYITQSEEEYPSALIYPLMWLWTLYQLLSILFCGKAQVALVGHAILQGTQSCVLVAPLHIGRTIQIHWHVDSKLFIDSLHQLGFCLSLGAIIKYERSAAVSQKQTYPTLLLIILCSTKMTVQIILSQVLMD